MPTKQIYCPIDKRWVNYEGGKVIPPDVIAEVGACGHNLPINSATREIDEQPDEEISNVMWE